MALMGLAWVGEVDFQPSHYKLQYFVQLPFVLSPSPPFILSLSKDERLSQGMLVEGKKGAGNEFLGLYTAFFVLTAYYTGHTDDLEKRIVEHQTGEIEGYTSTRLPVTLVFADEFPAREEALARERQIKGWSRKKKEAMMRGDWAEVSRLACIKRPSTGSGRTESKCRG